ncbi:MAG: hypothetical protein QOE00_2330 [Ilumatobacteraceae bacterium]
MADDDSKRRTLVELEKLLELSRQQQVRIKGALTRMLSILERDSAG